MAKELLTDTALRGIKAGDPRRRLSDGAGLYLLLFVKGGAHGWRLDYTHHGKRKTLSLGTYPDTGLALARRKAEEARRLVAGGTDPSDVRKAARAERLQRNEADAREAAGLPPLGSFETVAREWLANVHERDVSPGRAMRTRGHLEADVFPWIGRELVGDVTAPRLLEVLRRIEARGAVFSAHRVRQTCGQIFRYAITTGHAQRDPVPDLRGALARPITTHFAALTDPARVGELLRAIEGYEGQPGTRAALKLAALSFQRPGNIIAMQWVHLDLDRATWTIPSADMKRTKQAKVSGAPHVVPLSRQAVAVLTALQPLTGRGAYCFPGLRSHDRPISNVTMNAALRRLGFGADEMTSHGFRALARTVMVEQLPGIDPQWIEAQLAHGKAGPLGAAYDRAQYLTQRRHMMQVWADYLDRLRDGAQVLPFRTA